jgi:hypothetical protein
MRPVSHRRNETRDHIDVIKTALRILSAICERRLPDPADVAALRDYKPDLATLPVDDLACEVVQKFVRASSRRTSRAAEA